MRLASLLLAMGLGLAACGPTPQTSTPSPLGQGHYGARTDTGPNGEPIEINAVRTAYLTERNRRQRVPYNGPEAADTIVVDPYARFLYHVLGNGEAMRYGVAVGQAGKNFQGTATIGRKHAWPSWTPTANMVRTQPELYRPLRGGLPGGVDNPLGSRALYLYKGSRDTMYRIHGTMDPSSVGKATSAGCIRLFNQDIMDLFEQIPKGAPVKVRTRAESLALEGPLVELPNGYLAPAGEVETAAAEPVQ
ncbi:Lipoprotein-anchoring transpeptidase ErfK/SrfK [Paracoccus thiocyanatus]|uniref:Lipoprotein-anchoring transpeptidase ErfK/SrfK n=1 Tax=Paracoccus thiocyanatus TaxID=34006 RepID=A0A1N6XL32_9RHOB|nr:L,D-transpeptidase [Paracoccus thiocyanatus]SIR03065.1 Lipoprotein-anchoring transpeptidase ErfK/SrfK [Paracoccus thiocyanatus]